MEWTASEMCKWIKLLTDLNNKFAAAESTEDSDPARQAQSVWSESAAKAELARFQQENQQLWLQFANEQKTGLFAALAECVFAQYYLKAVRESIQDQDMYQKKVKAEQAAARLEHQKLHFTVEQLYKHLSVFAELANAVNLYQQNKDCMRLSVWTEYAEKLLKKEADRLEKELREKTSENEQKTAERKKAFAAQLQAMWKKSRAESDESAEADDAAASETETSRVNTKAAEAMDAFLSMYNPEKRMEDYLQRMALVQPPEDYHSPERVPDEIVFGTLIFDMAEAGFRQETIDFFAYNFPYLCSQTEIRMPLWLPLDANLNCLFRFPGAEADIIAPLMARMLAETLMMISPEHMSMMRITDASPFFFSDRLALFNNLVPDGQKSDEDKVGGSVHTSPDKMRQVLDLLMNRRMHIYQQVLQGMYDSLLAYQKKNPDHGESYTVLTAILNPKKADGAVMEKLGEIAAAGPSCGIFTWFCDASLEDEQTGLEKHMKHCFVYDSKRGRYRYEPLDSQLHSECQYPIWWEPIPFPNVKSALLPPDQLEQDIKSAQVALIQKIKG